MGKNYSTEEYISYLKSKGFVFREDALGFIEFGKHYTGSSDHLVNIAIEITLKAQKEFDGSFFMSFLELIKKEEVETKKHAYKVAEEKNII